MRIFLTALGLSVLSALPGMAAAQVDGITQPLEPPPNDDCSTEQKAVARKAERIAMYVTQDAILDGFFDHRDANGRPHWIIDRYFAANAGWSAWEHEELRSRLQDIHDRMAEGDVQIKCRDCDSNAQVFPIGRDRITLCTPFFSTSETYQAAVFVHELSHELFWTGDDRDRSGTPPREPWSEASRRHPDSYGETYGEEDPFMLAESYEAVAYTMIGEHFDFTHRALYGAAITRDRYEHELELVNQGRDIRREHLLTRRFQDGLSDGSSLVEADFDLIRDHLAAFGEDATFAVFDASAEHDFLADEPSWLAARRYVMHWADQPAVAAAIFQGQFAAKFVAIAL